MPSESTRPPFFELGATEEDCLRDIHFHLDDWEAAAKSELSKLGKSSDWRSPKANFFVLAHVLLKQEGHVNAEIANHKAYGMYITLEYISKVRDWIENKQFFHAIRYALKISYYFSKGDLFVAEAPRIYGAMGGRKTAVWSRDDHEKWVRLYEDLRARHPNESENYFVMAIVAGLQREDDLKPEIERRRVPSVSTVDKKLREMGIIAKVRKVGSVSKA